MGLDLVELVMAIEEEFGVHIDDNDSAHLGTPGLVTDYLCSRLRMSTTSPCQTQAGFYKLRTAISNTFGVDKKTILPSSSLASFLTGDTKKNWLQLQEALGSNFPRLQRSRPLFFSTVIVLPALLTYPILVSGSPSSFLGGITSFLVLCTLANFATYRMGSEIPKQTCSVAQLVRYVSCSDSTVWQRDEVLARVIKLTSEQLSIPVDQIQEHSHFVRDLGAG